MTDECKSLQVSDWCFSKMWWIRAHMHMPLSHLQCILLAQGSHKATFPQVFPKPGPEVEEGALLFPTSPLSTLTCAWELNQGYLLPEWVGNWKVLKNWPSLAQLQISHQSSALVLWLAGSHYGQVQPLKSAVCLPELAVPHGIKQISSEITMFSRRKFVSCFFKWDYA